MNRREGAGRRRIRLQGLIAEEVQSCLRDDVSDPEIVGVRVTAAVLSADCRSARVHVSVSRADSRDGAPDRDRVTNALVRATPFLRARIADAIEIKRVPDLRFVYEEVAEVGADTDSPWPA